MAKTALEIWHEAANEAGFAPSPTGRFGRLVIAKMQAEFDAAFVASCKDAALPTAWSAAERYDEAVRCAAGRFAVSYIPPLERKIILREECIAAIDEAFAVGRRVMLQDLMLFAQRIRDQAVAEERARCAGLARKKWVDDETGLEK